MSQYALYCGSCHHIHRSYPNQGCCLKCGWQGIKTVHYTIYKLEPCHHCDGKGKRINCYEGPAVPLSVFLSLDTNKTYVRHGSSVYERKWANKSGFAFIKDAIKEEKQRKAKGKRK